MTFLLHGFAIVVLLFVLQVVSFLCLGTLFFMSYKSKYDPKELMDRITSLVSGLVTVSTGVLVAAVLISISYALIDWVM